MEFARFDFHLYKYSNNVAILLSINFNFILFEI